MCSLFIPLLFLGLQYIGEVVIFDLIAFYQPTALAAIKIGFTRHIIYQCFLETRSLKRDLNPPTEIKK